PRADGVVTRAANARTPSTPYARRLARERGIPLHLLRGSGPNGRVVAADVSAHIASPESAPTPAAAAVAVTAVSAFASTINLSVARQPLADFAHAGHAFTLDDIVLRAVASTLADVSPTIVAGAAVAIELGRRQ